MSRYAPASFLIVALLVFSPLSSRAASIHTSDLLLGVQNELEDDNFELLVNAGGTVLAPGADPSLDVGDFLAGIFRITSLRQPPGGPQIATATDTEATVTAVFLAKVDSRLISAGGVADGNNDVNFRFAPPTLAEWSSVFAGTGSPIATSAGTMAILFDDPDNIDQSLPLGAAFGTVGGVEQWEVGMLGSAGELWTSNVDTASVATAFSITNGSFTANLNLTEQGAGPLLSSQAVVGGTADVLLRNGSVGSPAPGSSFPVSSDVDFLVTPVPEPLSALMLVEMLIAIGLLRRRR